MEAAAAAEEEGQAGIIVITGEAGGITEGEIETLLPRSSRPFKALPTSCLL